MHVYRLSSEPYLPTHWSYGDAWERVDGELVDRRSRGAQVWSSGDSVARAVLGCSGVDGDYSGEPLVLVLRVTDLSGDDGGAEWSAVTPDDVESVAAVDADAFRRWLRERYTDEDGDTEIPSDSDEEIEAWLIERAQPVSWEWRETLPAL